MHSIPFAKVIPIKLTIFSNCSKTQIQCDTIQEILQCFKACGAACIIVQIFPLSQPDVNAHIQNQLHCNLPLSIECVI